MIALHQKAHLLIEVMTTHHVMASREFLPGSFSSRCAPSSYRSNIAPAHAILRKSQGRALLL